MSNENGENDCIKGNEEENKQANSEIVKTSLTKQPKKTQAMPKPNKEKSKTEVIPRGLPKSKRPWKTPKKRFATIKKSDPRLTFEKKMELRNNLRHIKEVSRDIKEQRKEAKILKHKRRVENAERRLANEKRAEIVQIIKNPAKLKRMKKKQMRMIEKRDLSQVKAI